MVSDVKEFALENNGDVIDVGWETFGAYKKAFVDVEFSSVPDLSRFEEADNVSVDDEWGENRVMFEVTISERE